MCCNFKGQVMYGTLLNDANTPTCLLGQHICKCARSGREFGKRTCSCSHSRCSHTATRCNTLQHAATRCNTLQKLTALGNTSDTDMSVSAHTPLAHTLQHTATHCNTLQHTATHCNTLPLLATFRGFMQVTPFFMFCTPT